MQTTTLINKDRGNMKSLVTTPEYLAFLKRKNERLEKTRAAEAELRGTGRTTAQLKAMPKYGVFVSCNERAMHHDKNLTRKINRSNIVIVPPSWITGQRWQGVHYTAIEVDHAFWDLVKDPSYFNTQLSHALTRVRTQP